jgi:hypothetical protein
MFAHEVLTFGKPHSCEGGYVNRLGTAVKDQFGHTKANSGSDLETRTAKTAGQVESLRSRLAKDGTLVRGYAVNAAMRAMQGTTLHQRDTLTDALNGTVDKIWRDTVRKLCR